MAASLNQTLGLRFFGTGNFSQVKRGIRETRNEIRGASTQQAQLNKEFEKSTKTHGRARDAARRHHTQVSSLINSYHLLTGAIGLVAGSTVGLARKHEEELVKLQTQLGLTYQQVQKLKPAMRDLALVTGRALHEVAYGMFFIQSAGVRDAATALNTLRQSAWGAALQMGDTVQIANLLSSAVNQWGNQILSGSRAMDILIATVKEGKLVAADLPIAMARLLPIAGALGISFEEISAAVAAFTRTGATATMAATRVQSALAGLIEPTEKARAILDEIGLGVSGLQRMVRDKGFIRTLQELWQQLDPDVEKFSKLIDRLEALPFLFDLAIESPRKYLSLLQSIKESSGSLTQAQEALKRSEFFKQNQAFNKLRVAATDFGESILPLITKVADVLGTIFQFATENPFANWAIKASMVALLGKLGLALTGFGARWATGQAVGAFNAARPTNIGRRIGRYEQRLFPYDAISRGDLRGEVWQSRRYMAYDAAGQYARAAGRGIRGRAGGLFSPVSSYLSERAHYRRVMGATSYTRPTRFRPIDLWQPTPPDWTAGPVTRWPTSPFAGQPRSLRSIQYQTIRGRILDSSADTLQKRRALTRLNAIGAQWAREPIALQPGARLQPAPYRPLALQTGADRPNYRQLGGGPARPLMLRAGDPVGRLLAQNPPPPLDRFVRRGPQPGPSGRPIARPFRQFGAQPISPYQLQGWNYLSTGSGLPYSQYRDFYKERTRIRNDRARPTVQWPSSPFSAVNAPAPPISSRVPRIQFPPVLPSWPVGRLHRYGAREDRGYTPQALKFQAEESVKAVKETAKSSKRTAAAVEKITGAGNLSRRMGAIDQYELESLYASGTNQERRDLRTIKNRLQTGKPLDAKQERMIQRINRASQTGSINEDFIPPGGKHRGTLFSAGAAGVGALGGALMMAPMLLSPDSQYSETSMKAGAALMITSMIAPLLQLNKLIPAAGSKMRQFGITGYRAGSAVRDILLTIAVSTVPKLISILGVAAGAIRALGVALTRTPLGLALLGVAAVGGAIYAATRNTGTPRHGHTGGIATKPTDVLMGEAGPEALIPIDKLPDYMDSPAMPDSPEFLNAIRQLRGSNLDLRDTLRFEINPSLLGLKGAMEANFSTLEMGAIGGTGSQYFKMFEAIDILKGFGMLGSAGGGGKAEKIVHPLSTKGVVERRAAALPRAFMAGGAAFDIEGDLIPQDFDRLGIYQGRASERHRVATTERERELASVMDVFRGTIEPYVDPNKQLRVDLGGDAAVTAFGTLTRRGVGARVESFGPAPWDIAMSPNEMQAQIRRTEQTRTAAQEAQAGFLRSGGQTRSVGVVADFLRSEYGLEGSNTEISRRLIEATGAQSLGDVDLMNLEGPLREQILQSHLPEWKRGKLFDQEWLPDRATIADLPNLAKSLFGQVSSKDQSAYSRLEELQSFLSGTVATDEEKARTLVSTSQIAERSLELTREAFQPVLDEANRIAEGLAETNEASLALAAVRRRRREKENEGLTRLTGLLDRGLRLNVRLNVGFNQSLHDAIFWTGQNSFDIQQNAAGGIATKPTLGIFGEAGSEALIPLDRLDEFVGGGAADRSSRYVMLLIGLLEDIRRNTEMVAKEEGSSSSGIVDALRNIKVKDGYDGDDGVDGEKGEKGEKGDRGENAQANFMRKWFVGVDKQIADAKAQGVTDEQVRQFRAVQGREAQVAYARTQGVTEQQVEKFRATHRQHAAEQQHRRFVERQVEEARKQGVTDEQVRQFRSVQATETIIAGARTRGVTDEQVQMLRERMREANAQRERELALTRGDFLEEEFPAGRSGRVPTSSSRRGGDFLEGSYGRPVASPTEVVVNIDGREVGRVLASRATNEFGGTI